MNKTGFILTLSFFVHVCFAQSVLYTHHEVGTGYHVIALNTAVQDAHGMFWIGTDKGLYSFDGSAFHPEPVLDSVHSDITALYCDSEKLWIGFRNGTLAHRSLRTWVKGMEADTSFISPVTGIKEGSNGQIWVATYGNGLFVHEKNTWYHLASHNGLPADEIYGMEKGKDGSIWIGTDGGLTQCHFQDGKKSLKTFTSDDGLPDNIVKCMVVAEDGILWLGTYGAGVCTFDPDTKKFSVPSFSNYWSYGSVRTLAIQSNKRLMIGTSTDGVLSVALQSGFHVSLLNEATGYEDEKITDLLVDNEGNFWACTAKNSFDQFPALFELGGINVQGVQAVLFDNRDNLWYATLEGLYITPFDSSKSLRSEKVFLPVNKSPVITSLFQDKNGNIWVGTFDEGVFFSLNGSRLFYRLQQTNGLVNNNILSINSDQHSIWISTLGGVSRCPIPSGTSLPHFEFENFTHASGLHSSYIYQAFVDSRNRVWFATDGEGLKMFDQNTFTTFESAGSNSIKTVYSITEDGEHNIWFSTPSSGIFKFDGKNFHHYGEESDISDFKIAGITSDVNGDILIFENDGLEILETKTDQIRHYVGGPFFEDIYPNLNAFYQDRFHNIWLATRKGILKYYPPESSFSHEAQLELSQVLIYLRPIDFSLTNRFGHRENHVTFEYQGFWNYDPTEIRYRYKLEGYDLNWIQTKDERVIYPNLPPGSYDFIVQATIHHNFNDAATATYSFSVLPPFWYTWWFVGSSIVIIISAIYFFIFLREKQIEKEEKLKRERIEFQLENLKTQINPHFLFNSFNTLATLIEEDQDTAVTYVSHLSDFFRSILKYKDTDLITVKEECELVKNFVFLLKQRHGDALQIEEGISQATKEMLIPPLTIQLLIENAVKHNIVSQDLPLKIHIFSKNGDLYIRNNLQRRKEAVSSTRIGLQNISARFELLGGSRVEINERPNSFEVHLKLFKNSIA